MAVSTVVAILVIYFAIRYRRRSEDIPEQIDGALLLEILWTVIPLLIVIVMFVWSAGLYFNIVEPPEEALEVYVTGRQWMWKLQHPQGQREINELHIPVGSREIDPQFARRDSQLFRSRFPHQAGCDSWAIHVHLVPSHQAGTASHLLRSIAGRTIRK